MHIGILALYAAITSGTKQQYKNQSTIKYNQKPVKVELWGLYRDGRGQSSSYERTWSSYGTYEFLYYFDFYDGYAQVRNLGSGGWEYPYVEIQAIFTYEDNTTAKTEKLCQEGRKYQIEGRGEIKITWDLNDYKKNITVNTLQWVNI